MTAELCERAVVVNLSQHLQTGPLKLTLATLELEFRRIEARPVLNISSRARDKVSNAVLITGAARSGTTIAGQIVHSFEGVEYAFEPPVLFSLFSLIDSLPEAHWRLLYKTYLYEEHYINALCGRNINCNRQDDSSIYKVKDAAEIEIRLSKSTRKIEAEQAGKNSVIAFKIPGVVPFLPRLLAYYPQTRIVMLRRDHIDTLNSLYRKQWFTDENATRNLIWPFTVHAGMQMPFWVAESDHERWRAMTALDRCAYYYAKILESIEQVRPRIDIDYQRLLDAPQETAEDLAGRLGLSFGAKTMEILAGIKPRTSERDRSIMRKIDPELAARIRNVESPPAVALPGTGFGGAGRPLELRRA